MKKKAFSFLLIATVLAISAEAKTDRNFILQPPGTKTVINVEDQLKPTEYKSLPGWRSTLFAGIIYAATDVAACTIAGVAYVAGQVVLAVQPYTQ